MYELDCPTPKYGYNGVCNNCPSGFFFKKLYVY